MKKISQVQTKTKTVLLKLTQDQFDRYTQAAKDLGIDRADLIRFSVEKNLKSLICK